MKKNKRLMILCITLLLVLTGCLAPSSLSGTGADTEADPHKITIGSHLTVHNTDERLTLLDNMDTLSADGLYYASWTAGNAEPYENAEGDTVDLYDARLYLLLGEYDTPESAQKNADDWLNAGRGGYSVTDEETVICGGQTYTVITYAFANEDNPYARGVSAFGAIGSDAVCAELTCREQYDENIEEMLITFLDGFAYP